MPPDDVPFCPNPTDADCHCPECEWGLKHGLMPSLEEGIKRDGHA